MQSVTFGETMIRFSPPDFKRLEQTETLNMRIGGSEMNAAVAARRMGIETAYVTKLPDNSLGRFVRNKIREQGVDTSNIIWGGGAADCILLNSVRSRTLAACSMIGHAQR